MTSEQARAGQAPALDSRGRLETILTELRHDNKDLTSQPVKWNKQSKLLS